MTTPPDKSHIGGSAGKAVSTPNRLPSSKKLYKETVKILVGPEKEAYSVHKELLCFYSDFFRAAFNGSFKEAIESQIELPDAEISIFEAFQTWLYARTLLNAEDPMDKPDRPFYHSHPILAKLWIFGDKYQIPLLQNNVIDTMHEKVEKDKLAPSTCVALAYENTLPGSCLRRAVVDIVAHRALLEVQDGACGPQYRQYWTLDASMDMMAAIASAWRSKLIPYTFLKTERCHYHVHAEGEHC
ncbi:hypothetical protein D6C91_10074 [Aureobasidium pullulans]|uniref:BTB domain-containing protein n=1 Tax=Aureobasidium pullulans TaxID=5580 RepID=A0A4S9SED8_AURPU|nr:hypothetical protein D6C91_10074 [Aureobasidium pullulans]